jgi:CRISPR-associated endonuclease/helicase Cas3
LERALESRRAQTGEKSGPAAKLAALRAEVSDACRDAAQQPVGRFRLTVPTGGGKTLSGLRFALHHAVQHGLERVIVVIPYTSILEQTVHVYRGLFDAIDPNAVIEHHSSLDPAGESQEHRWACENWDAPIVVTTSVQFFETLYAHHKRRCRKLHRVANSVVLLDEVQTFPLELLDPIQQALDHLEAYFHTTVVSMTATQPLLQRETEREIVPAPAGLYSVVHSRFHVEWLGEPETPVTWDAVAARAAAEERVLVIVHARKDAELVATMLGPDCVHLSARMCAAHRLTVIEDVRRRLKQPGPCRVVATQLVEAGVDLDFPVVMRAFAGLDTLAQAAGRCNREFAPEPGRFVIFRAPTRPPAPSLVAGLNASQQLYCEGRFDLNDPALFALYTERVLQTRPRDPDDVLGKEERLDFPGVAASFRMIDSSGAAIIVPYEGGWSRVQQMRLAPDVPLRERLRRLQRYTVTVYPQELRRLRAEGLIEPLLPCLSEESQDDGMPWVIRGDMQPCPYSERFGLSWQAMEVEPLTMMA